MHPNNEQTEKQPKKATKQDQRHTKHQMKHQKQYTNVSHAE